MFYFNIYVAIKVYKKQKTNNIFLVAEEYDEVVGISGEDTKIMCDVDLQTYPINFILWYKLVNTRRDFMYR